MTIFASLNVFADTVPRGGAAQMALDEALLEYAPEPVFRIYRWDGPAVSFGYSQSLAAVAANHPDRPLVRRWTGGGIVEHGEDWTFSLVVPSGVAFARIRPVETYRLIHEAVAAGLAQCGIPARLAAAEESRRGAACFTAPAPQDVMAPDGRKLCGGAQRRTRRGFLHQGSLLGVTLPGDFAARLGVVLAREVTPFVPSENLLTRSEDLAIRRYGAADWLAKIP